MSNKAPFLDKFTSIPTILQWTFGGMAGGLVVGIVLVALNGPTLLSTVYWIGFGLVVGALAGAIGWGITWLVKKIIPAQ